MENAKAHCKKIKLLIEDVLWNSNGSVNSAHCEANNEENIINMTFAFQSENQFRLENQNGEDETLPFISMNLGISFWRKVVCSPKLLKLRFAQ